MTHSEALAWIGASCFFARFLVQWVASERAGQSITPPGFWWMSMLGVVLCGAFAAEQHEPVLLFGYLVNGSIYARNLALVRAAEHRPPSPWLLGAIALAGLFGLVLVGSVTQRTTPLSGAWLVVGAVGQALWSARFVVQWYCSERAGRSHLPPAFWWISLGGNTLLLAYTLRLGEPVFVAQYALGPLIQIRNLILLHRGKAREGAAGLG